MKMKFYRFSNFVSIYGVEIRESHYDLLRETPRGYWIEKYGFEKWVSKTSRKRFAYPDRKQALRNFIARKERQIKICTSSLSSAKIALNQAENMKCDGCD